MIAGMERALCKTLVIILRKLKKKKTRIHFGCCRFMDSKGISSHTFIFIPKEKFILIYVRSSEMHSFYKM